jgi:hypothetical protein
MKILSISIISFLVSFLFLGCGTSIKLSQYQPALLKKSKFIPSKNRLLSNELPKVIIIDIDNNNIKLAKKSNLGSSIATKINSLLSSIKSVNILKRVKKLSNDKILLEEVKASQLSKQLGTNVGQADYIITGKLSNANYDYKFSEGYYTTYNTKNGPKQEYTPPSIKYSSCVTGNIKIFELPILKEIKSYEFNDCIQSHTDVRSPRDARKKDYALVRQAGNLGADTISYELKNFFSKKGYIYEMRQKDDDIIIKTTLGLDDNIKENQEVEIYTIEEVENILTKTKSKDIIKIGKGKVSNQITQKNSWIIVDELYNNKDIKAGDFIKIEYKEGFFSKATKSLMKL